MKTVSLTQGKVALVDDEDFERISRLKWCIIRGGGRGNNLYAFRTSWDKSKHRRVGILMHRLILNTRKEDQIDHINGNGLDNQRNNLRLATQQQNMWNRRKRVVCGGDSSVFKGVVWDKARNKWLVKICYSGRYYHVGRFIDEKEAALAYDVAVRKYFGNYARPNFS